MAINKVQFQKGLSIAQFMGRYGTKKCHAALVVLRWPTGFVGPSCAGSRHCTFERKGLQYWQYSVCREQTTTSKCRPGEDHHRQKWRQHSSH
jgi:hypothetical protein